MSIALVIGCSAPAASPVTTPVQDTTPVSPKLGISPTTIDVVAKEGQSTTQKKSFNIANEGGGVMLYAARESAQWMWMNASDGALEKGYSKSLDLFIAPSGLPAGKYTEKVNIEGTGASNSPQSITVTMTINPADAPVTDTGKTVVKNPTPPPPWEYNEYVNNTYDFRLRYPKNYSSKQVSGITFGAASPNNEDPDTILLNISGSYGVDYKSSAEELVKVAMRAAGAGRLNLRIIADDNTTTLADGVTPAYEMLYESKSSQSASYHCYVFGTQKGSRYVVFLGCAPLPGATDKLELWKQTAHTLEFTD